MPGVFACGDVAKLPHLVSLAAGDGAMIARDGRKVLSTQNRHDKCVPWESIAEALKLETRWAPRPA